ncbi:MAG TPA: hypothetical protein PK854_08870 [Oscillospiraceae bacterium]|nr:hypothetical protein [Oscillospiraceae bacterium]HPS35365.1 hypothetical protein [Oscillospiraceae bacterium]
MKKLVCGLLVFVLMMGCVLGCSNKAEIPARGVWDGRTYTNTEAEIRLTVAEGFEIGTDEKIIKTYGFSNDYFEDLKSKQDYFDIFIEDKTSGSYSRMYIQYYTDQLNNTTAEQNLNLYKSDHKTFKYYNDDRPDLNIIYGDNFELTLCGMTYICCSFTLEGIDQFYQLMCYRITTGNAVALINIRGKSAEKVNTYLAFFNTANVN